VQRRYVLTLVVGLLLAVLLIAAGAALYEPSDPEGSAVIYDGDKRVATVDLEIADDQDERWEGLSTHDSLADDEGMLFVYDEPGNHTFVMRQMDFGIDIIYVDANGCITSVNPAPEPGPNETGSNQEYPGYGQYVIEVPIGLASENGIAAGDPVRIEYGGTTVDGAEETCFES